MEGRGRFPSRGGSGQDGSTNRGRGGSTPRGGRGYDTGRGSSSPAPTRYQSSDNQSNSHQSEPINKDPAPEVSNVVKDLEKQTFAKSLDLKMAQISIQERPDPPQRPGYGTEGKVVKLWANYFELSFRQDSPHVYQYAVEFIPPTETQQPKGKKLARLVALLLKQEFPNIMTVTDYAQKIICATSLGLEEQRYEVSYYPETISEAQDTSPRFTAKVTYIQTITFAALLNYLASTDINLRKPDEKEDIIQAANIIAGHGMKSNSTILSRTNKYFPTSGPLTTQSDLSTFLTAFRGFFMSVRPATGRLLLNVQIQHIAAWPVLPLSTLLRNMRSSGMQDREIHRTISGLRVALEAPGNPSTQQIVGFATPRDGQGFQNPPRVTRGGAKSIDVQFYRNGALSPGYISVAAYFNEVHHESINPQDDVVNIGTVKKPTYVLARLYSVKTIQAYNKKLSPQATASMIHFAVRGAHANRTTIVNNGTEFVKTHTSTSLDSFGIEFNPKMITVEGRVLPPPIVEYHKNKPKLNNASWNLAKQNFNRGGTVSKWAAIWVQHRGRGGSFRQKSEVDDSVKKFVETLKSYQVKAESVPQVHVFNIDNPDNPAPEVKAFVQKLKDLELLLCILPSADTATYNAFKKAGDVDFGIHTVAVLADRKKFAGGHPAYLANVALKINLKLGGINHLLSKTNLGFVADGKTMIVGLDVTHPSPGSAETAPSVSSIVASIKPDLAQWPAAVRLQLGNTEIIDGLKDMFTSRLALWQKHNQFKLPEEIIVYRDGVGESMYNLVIEKEIPLMKKACEEAYAKSLLKTPYLTVIICGKRHHTRFYPTNLSDKETSPGTVVDRGVTETRIWDFFLQAHQPIQGTARPAHYVVVHDEIFRRRAENMTKGEKFGLTDGQVAQNSLESLTHAMCYMFGRATRAVSLCPPAYYADLVCDRARLWLSNFFDENIVANSEQHDFTEADHAAIRVHPRLENSMFYI